MNHVLQLGWALRRRLIGLLRLRTRGVKVMLFDRSGALLLIRNSYGNTGAWVLPGGGVGWREEPRAAAAREINEEVGIAGVALELVGTYESTGEGKRDRISLFQGAAAQPGRIDGREIAEAGFFPLNALPSGTSAATRRRVAEWKAGGPFGGAW